MYSLSPPLKLLRILSTYVIVLLAFLAVSCGESNSKNESSRSQKVVLKQSFKDKMAKEDEEKFFLLDNACLYCHRIVKLEEEKVAPDMKEIVDVYRSAHPEKQKFIDAFVQFTVTPNKNLSIMPGAVREYGLMDDAGHTKDDIEDIAEYLFEYDF